MHSKRGLIVVVCIQVRIRRLRHILLERRQLRRSLVNILVIESLGKREGFKEGWNGRSRRKIDSEKLT